MAALTFRYTARTAAGQIVRGSMQAPDVLDVVESLRTRALFATNVDPANDLSDRLSRMFRLRRIAHIELVGFFRSFATLIRAGVSIGRALNVTIERARDPRLAEALRSVLADVEHGSALSAALARRPHDFPALYVAMIRAGEAGGILDDVLDRLAVLLEREAALSKKLASALAYPAIVLTAALALIIFLVVKIIPMFAQIFAGFRVELPLATQILIGIAAAVQTPFLWLALATFCALAAFGLYRFSRTSAGAMLLDRVRLSAPIVGPLLHKAIQARVARMLATLLRSGVELVGAIDAVIPIAGSVHYARAFDDVNAALRNGGSLAPALDATYLFDPILLALVRVGEETGLVDEMLLNVARYFESDVEATIATLGAVLEPALILFLGLIVGFIVCSIFIPLYSLIGNLSP